MQTEPARRIDEEPRLPVRDEPLPDPRFHCMDGAGRIVHGESVECVTS
jgi:hypothetical protein